MSENSCGVCAKRRVVDAHLECRARPPAADPITGAGRWPRVGPADYCHSDFEPQDVRRSAEDTAGRARRARPERVAAAELPL